MTEMTLAVLGLLVFAWAVLSGAAERRNVTGPMVFAVAGYVLCNPDWGVLELDVETAAVESLVEVTLALLLFSDAARVNVRELRRDVGLPVRLLGIGLPLSVLAGAGLAAGLMPELPWALAGFLGAALAPTDAALSGAVINDERLPIRLRRSLNVESGLNDGMATPIVTVMLAIAASQLGEAGGSEAIQAGTALRELGVGVLVGVAVGICGASAVNWAARRAWIAPGGRRLAALALALGAFMLSTAIEGNGFVAAFVAGIAWSCTRCSVSRSFGWRRWAWRCSAPGWTAPASPSWRGSVPADSPRSCSRCSPSNPSGRAPTPAVRSPPSRSPC